MGASTKIEYDANSLGNDEFSFPCVTCQKDAAKFRREIERGGEKRFIGQFKFLLLPLQTRLWFAFVRKAHLNRRVK